MIASPSAASSRNRPQRQAGKRLAEQIADHQPVRDAGQALLGGGAYGGVRFAVCGAQRLQPRLGLRIARFAQQLHRLQTHLRIGVAQLQVGQRDAQRVAHRLIRLLRQPLFQQRPLVALRVTLQRLRRLQPRRLIAAHQLLRRQRVGDQDAQPVVQPHFFRRSLRRGVALQRRPAAVLPGKCAPGGVQRQVFLFQRLQQRQTCGVGRARPALQ
ncbi:Uncharacterised protein [Serratia rubidaea]|uniref:Uncharacterized protein n=1 Tax=Serratia rubidaea TaxID=61652 RepID=A0A4U9HBM6_SERRU|nr:Uncharacterised protein [Serratia rubidaea]